MGVFGTTLGSTVWSLPFQAPMQTPKVSSRFASLKIHLWACTAECPSGRCVCVLDPFSHCMHRLCQAQRCEIDQCHLQAQHCPCPASALLQGVLRAWHHRFLRKEES